MAGALIVTAEIGRDDFAWLNGLRAMHYPTERNRVPAHLTIFHALPPSAEPEIRSRLAGFAAGRKPVARVDGLMSGDIFGCRQDGDVHASGKRRKEEGRCPGVVDYGHDVSVGRRRAYCGHILNFHRVRTRAFEDDGPSTFRDEVCNVGAYEGRVVSRDNAEPLQDRVAKASGRPIDAVGDKELVAGRKQSEQRPRNR